MVSQFEEDDGSARRLKCLSTVPASLPGSLCLAAALGLTSECSFRSAALFIVGESGEKRCRYKLGVKRI